PGRVSPRPLQQARKPLDLSPDWGEDLRGGIFHFVCVQEPDAGPADGRDVRCRLPPLCCGLRAPGRRGLRAVRGGVVLCNNVRTPIATEFVRHNAFQPDEVAGLAGSFAASSPSIASASMTQARRTCARPMSPYLRSRWISRPLREAAARETSPTGLPGPAPPAPA